MKTNRLMEREPGFDRDDLMVTTGAGGFIGGNLALYFKNNVFTLGQNWPPQARRVIQAAGLEPGYFDLPVDESFKTNNLHALAKFIYFLKPQQAVVFANFSLRVQRPSGSHGPGHGGGCVLQSDWLLTWRL